MIKFIRPYFHFKDSRGAIQGIIQEGNWKEINIIHSKKGTRRGDHYHKKVNELFVILTGKIRVHLQSYDEKERTMQIVFLSGDVFIVEKGTYHTFEILENSRWINALDGIVKDDTYKKT